MSALFWETITPDMRSILSEFTQSDLGAKFYLAGDTALALQLGHRLSMDLDFFSPIEDIPTMRHALEKNLSLFTLPGTSLSGSTATDMTWSRRWSKGRRPALLPWRILPL